MKDKTKVKAKNVWKVAKIKAVNPNATYREIQKKTWLSQATISKANEDLKQNWSKDETIAYIVGSAKNRIKRVSKLFDRYVDEIEEKDKLERADIALAKEIVKDDLQRTTIFWWNVTDDEWWLVVQTISFLDFIDKKNDEMSSFEVIPWES